MDRYDWVIMNTKKKMTITEAFNWYNSRDCEILECLRASERGARDTIYVIGSGYGYGNVGQRASYITDTGLGYGGKGTVTINKIYHANDMDKLVNSKIKHGVWVFK